MQTECALFTTASPQPLAEALESIGLEEALETLRRELELYAAFWQDACEPPHSRRTD